MYRIHLETKSQAGFIFWPEVLAKVIIVSVLVLVIFGTLFSGTPEMKIRKMLIKNSVFLSNEISKNIFNRETNVIAITNIESDMNGLIQDFLYSNLPGTVMNATFVDREKVGNIEKEIAFQLTDMVNRKTRVNFGGITGANLILAGQYVSEKNNILTIISHYDIYIHFKLIDVETGLIVWSDSIDDSFFAKYSYN